MEKVKSFFFIWKEKMDHDDFFYSELNGPSA